MFTAKFPCGEVVPFGLDSSTSLGKGATAAVCSLVVGDKRYAAKLYKAEHIPDEKKILSMYEMSDPSEPPLFSTAWPLAAITSNDHIRGYLMNSFERADHYPLNYYFDSTFSKKLKASDFLSLSNRVEIARSLCSAVAAIHSTEAYLIDLKPQNILINWRSNACVLLDCDGFSIKSQNGRRFPASHISTDYIAPEVTKHNLSPTELGEGQDNYALGVILFQLFNYAQHPFQGTAVKMGLLSATNDEQAAAGLYPYGLTANNLIAPRKGSTHVCMPIELRNLFDRTFSGKPSDRVSASEWVIFFGAIIESKGLKRCDRYPNNPTHVHFVKGSCPECLREQASSDFKKEALLRSKTTAAKPSPDLFGGGKLPGPQPQNNTARNIIVGALVAILLLVLINAESSSSSGLSVNNIPRNSVQTTSASIDPIDISQVAQADILDIVSSSYRLNSDGVTGTLTVRLPSTYSTSSIPNPGLFLASFSCLPRTNEIRQAQEALSSLGFNIGIVDGIIGPVTISAIKDFQRRSGIAISGELDFATADLLDVYVQAHDSSRFKFDRRGTVRFSPTGLIIDFKGIRPAGQFCFYVSRR